MRSARRTGEPRSRPGKAAANVAAATGLAAALAAGMFAGLPPAEAESGPVVSSTNRTAGGADGRETHTGTIDGAEYRVEMPERWNGALVLYSHGYFLPDWVPEGVQVANRVETETWLLEHGYALAASKFKNNGVSYAVEDGLADQLALLDWFETEIGKPERTITSGMSQGAVISILLAERNPDRFDGVVSLCGEVDTHASWNSALDITYVVKTLLAPGENIELVKSSDPAADTQALSGAIEEARTTPEGRARLALAGAIANIPPWYNSHAPEPTALADRIVEQSLWLQWAYTVGLGPTGRVDLEQRTGGNPSWNVGIDYSRLLYRSAYGDLVEDAYAEAPGADLQADLAALAEAPRIRPDAEALAYQYRYGVVRGDNPWPVITLHTTGDGGAVSDQMRWYAEEIRQHGNPADLRQLYVERGGHCSFSAADEIVTIQALVDRIETGRWPSTSPPRLNAEVNEFGPEFQKVLDLGTGTDAPLPPAFTRFTPPQMLRPSH